MPVGIAAFGVGEHHRPDFAISAPEVVLAAIAARTSRILLGSAVTVLSTDDPVRVYQRFSTLDALSGGRAEVILGRGSFTESFPLFGFDLAQYELLFEEKLALFAALQTGEPVTWSGRTRAALTEQRVYPPIESGRLPHLDRRRRQPGIGGAGGALRLPAHDRDHRRHARPASGRSSTSTISRSSASATRRCPSPPTRPATSPTPTSARARRSGRTTAR